MKECLNCNKPYEPKRSTSKFCSNKCRAAHARKGQSSEAKVSLMEKIVAAVDEITEVKMFIQGLMAKAKSEPHQPFFGVATKEGVKWGETLEKPAEIVLELTYNQAMDELRYCTSSAEIEKVWRKILAKKDWAGWQMRELSKTKEDQRTKIDF